MAGGAAKREAVGGGSRLFGGPALGIIVGVCRAASFGWSHINLELDIIHRTPHHITILCHIFLVELVIRY